MLHNNVYIKQACLIFNDDWQILAIKRSTNDKSRPGLRDIPGWGAEFFDTDKWDALQASILREIKEEVGIKTRNLTELLISSESKSEQNPDNDLRMFIMYLAEYVSWEPVLSDEHTDYKRIPIEKFLELDSGWLQQYVEKSLHILASQ